MAKIDIVFDGYNGSDEWKHYRWNVFINGEPFGYKTGIGHATPFFKTYDNSFGTRNTPPKNKRYIIDSKRNEWIHIPDIDDVLECLFSDAECGAMSFKEFCDNMGYSNDSIKALDTYRACMDITSKLYKALGSEYVTTKERIEKRRDAC